jgi:hypothetical protein
MPLELVIIVTGYIKKRKQVNIFYYWCDSAAAQCMTGILCQVALRAMHAALPSSLRVSLTFRNRFLGTIKCEMDPDLRNFKV